MVLAKEKKRKQTKTDHFSLFCLGQNRALLKRKDSLSDEHKNGAHVKRKFKLQ